MEKSRKFPLDSKRIYILITGIIIMVIGLFIMTLDKEPFGFGLLGITLGPIIVLIGVFIPIYSLFNFKNNVRNISDHNFRNYRRNYRIFANFIYSTFNNRQVFIKH